MPTAGLVEIGGRNVTYLRPRHRNVGMVFQQNVLYGHLSVFDNLAYPLKVRGFDRASIRKKVQDVTGALQIGDILRRMPDQLSGVPRRSKWNWPAVECGVRALHAAKVWACEAGRWNRKMCSRSGLA